MKKYNVGVMGATGAVGQEMIKILAERDFPVGELRCLASERSEGKGLSTPFGDVTVKRTCETAFDGLDFVLTQAEGFEKTSGECHTLLLRICREIPYPA